MVRGERGGFFDVTLVFLLLLLLVSGPVAGLLMVDHPRDADDDQELNKAILEMLHINKVSASHQAKPHPYMRKVYLRLDSLEAQDFGRSDGTLVQSFRSVVGKLDITATKFIQAVKEMYFDCKMLLDLVQSTQKMANCVYVLQISK